MCVIVYKPSNRNITYHDLKEMWKANPDGAGIVILTNPIQIEKGFLTFKDLYKTYQQLRFNDLVIHFRLGTSATISRKNCHPFPLKLRNHHIHYLMHNGVIPGYGSKKITDTEDYIQRVLCKQKSIIGVINCLESTLGKFVLFDSVGNFYNIGEFKEYKGLWCSNLYFSFTDEYSLTAKQN